MITGPDLENHWILAGSAILSAELLASLVLQRKKIALDMDKFIYVNHQSKYDRPWV
jgi:hypothetical protein